jgi:hypothetical protein
MPKEIEFVSSTTRHGYATVVGKVDKSGGTRKIRTRSLAELDAPAASSSAPTTPRKSARTPVKPHPHESYPDEDGMPLDDETRGRKSQGDVSFLQTIYMLCIGSFLIHIDPEWFDGAVGQRTGHISP